jgi:GAF domain-containing protein
MNWLRNILSSEDDNDPKFVSLVRNILIVVFIFVLLLAIGQSGVLTGSITLDTFIILIVIDVFVAFFIYLTFQRVLWPGKLFLPPMLLAAITYFVVTANGLHDVAVAGYPVAILLASLLMGRKSLPFWTIMTGLCIILVGYFDMAGLTPEPVARTTRLDTIVVGILIIATNAGLANVVLRRFQEIIAQSRKNENEQITANKELKILQATLEQRVEERTGQLEKRASQLEAISNVARSIASIQDLGVLLTGITRLISDQFGFYHVGIFLLDENREYAILRAANSEGGHRMLDRQHKLRLGSNSIVGYVTSREEPRIALDVGADAVYFNNPDLPNTRSEMALPLRLAGKVIGALDVQSTESNAFTDEDIATLSTLADQVAIALENARLFSESREALRESQDTFDKYIKQEWSSFAKQARQTGFLYDGKRIVPFDGNKQPEQKRNILQTGQLSLEKDSPTIAIPIKLRGQTIGMLDIRSKTGHREWTQDEITLLEAAAERAALALENARLVESAQRRAARERAIGEISSRIGTFGDLNSILQSAVEELGRKIGSGTEVTIELGGEND